MDKYVCCKNKKPKQDLNTLVGFLKIISEENRIKILCILKEEEKCVCEIWKILGITQNLASHHLRVLKDVGLIKSRKQGLSVFYKINKKVFDNHLTILSKFL